jgi:hypothetical protein
LRVGKPPVESSPRQKKQDWILKCLQGGRAHPLAACVWWRSSAALHPLLETEFREFGSRIDHPPLSERYGRPDDYHVPVDWRQCTQYRPRSTAKQVRWRTSNATSEAVSVYGVLEAGGSVRHLGRADVFLEVIPLPEGESVHVHAAAHVQGERLSPHVRGSGHPQAGAVASQSEPGSGHAEGDSFLSNSHGGGFSPAPPFRWRTTACPGPPRSNAHPHGSSSSGRPRRAPPAPASAKTHICRASPAPWTTCLDAPRKSPPTGEPPTRPG